MYKRQIDGGSTGENLLLDIEASILKKGTRLTFEQVELEITTPAAPCKTIRDSFTSGEFKQLSHKLNPYQTRWYARVISEGIIKSDEMFEINLTA